MLITRNHHQTKQTFFFVWARRNAEIGHYLLGATSFHSFKDLYEYEYEDKQKKCRLEIFQEEKISTYTYTVCDGCVSYP